MEIEKELFTSAESKVEGPQQEQTISPTSSSLADLIEGGEEDEETNLIRNSMTGIRKASNVTLTRVMMSGSRSKPGKETPDCNLVHKTNS